jgi:hypothetical protein
MSKYETKFESGGQNGINIGCFVGAIIGLGMFQAAYGAFSEDDVSFGFILIIIGIFALIYSYHLGVNMITGECPYCGNKVQTFKNQLNTRCKACRKRIVIKDDKFLGIE